jgi:hypothetical protein
MFAQTHPIVLFLLFAILVWVGVLTILLFRAVRHYNRLTGSGNVKGMREVLEGMLRTQASTQAGVRSLEKLTARLAQDGELHVQRIGIVRFNPFADTGGAQSFTMAILDSHNNGVVMTSLYGRSGNRWYVKEVAGGAGKEVELSKEEESAIKNAKKPDRVS